MTHPDFPADPGTTRSTGADFETLPYTSHPYGDSRPAHLAAIASLLGFRAPAPDTARVVELGCASGGNIIPLAMAFPKGRYLGIDLSPRHVEIAQAKIAALGLTNIEIRVGDLGERGLIEGEWDYAICHGVFSWVPEDVQAQILETCNSCLAQNGLAYLSYNVLPGWQLRKVVRDIFLFDDDPSRDVSDRVARGRWLLEQMAQGTASDSDYGRLLRREAEMLSRQSDTYIMAEFLAEENRPCYFHDFMARAKTSGLAFLGETRANLNALSVLQPQLDAKLRTLAGPSQELYEHYYDTLVGRQFRQSILYRAAPNAGFKRNGAGSQLTAMHFCADLRVIPVDGEEGNWQVRNAEGLSFRTNDPAVIATFQMLAACFPATRSPRQILDALNAQEGLDKTSLSERIMKALLQTTLAGLAHPLMTPVTIGGSEAQTPQIWAYTQHELEQGQSWVTTRAHRSHSVDKPMARLLPLLDGTRSRGQITAEISTILQNEADSLGLLDMPVGDPDEVARYAEHIFSRAAKMGVLMPERG